MHEQHQQCIKLCQECHATCLETVQHCLTMGGPHADPAHIRLMLDCVEICQTSANFMLRHSPLHGRTCAACSEICEACAADCERLSDDSRMKICADACRRCAQECRRMAAMAA
jgi:hypothetical protein